MDSRRQAYIDPCPVVARIQSCFCVNTANEGYGTLLYLFRSFYYGQLIGSSDSGQLVICIVIITLLNKRLKWPCLLKIQGHPQVLIVLFSKSSSRRNYSLYISRLQLYAVSFRAYYKTSDIFNYK